MDFLRLLETLCGRKGAGNVPDNGLDPFMTDTKRKGRGQKGPHQPN